jgi:outer membrane lipoprotein-sorting protein
MLRFRLLAACLLSILFGAASLAKEDALASITRSFRTSPCVTIAFQEVVHSQVFNEVQTVNGLLVFDTVGRYKIELGDDLYLRTDSTFYSYSKSTNQVIIEKVGESTSTASVIWIRHLDDYFESAILVPDKRYKLTAKPEMSADVPESLTVFISGGKRIDRIEFIDANGDLTVLKVQKQVSSDDCKKDVFEPAFPDSVERVRL